MLGGCVRSALVLSWSEQLDGPSHPGPTPPTLELARLLGDQSIGGFEVSMMSSADTDALRLELIRFLADRAPQDRVVLHLAGPLVLDHPGAGPRGADPVAAPRPEEPLPLAFLQAELARCRSERMVIVVDCAADAAVASASPAPVGRQLALGERLWGPGRSVHLASTATVIEALQGTPGADRPADSQALRRALLAPRPDVRAPRVLPPLLRGALMALGAVVFVASAALMAALGVAGMALSAAALAVVAWPLAELGVREWRRLPRQEVVLGEGVDFYELYMLRRSKKSKDHFRHHGTR